jgi:hypothetical protein
LVQSEHVDLGVVDVLREQTYDVRARRREQAMALA